MDAQLPCVMCVEMRNTNPPPQRADRSYRPISQVFSSLRQAVERPEVAPVGFIGAKSHNFLAVSGETQIALDNREHPFFRHERQQSRGDNVNARERQGLAWL